MSFTDEQKQCHNVTMKVADGLQMCADVNFKTQEALAQCQASLKTSLADVQKERDEYKTKVETLEAQLAKAQGALKDAPQKAALAAAKATKGAVVAATVTTKK